MSTINGHLPFAICRLAVWTKIKSNQHSSSINCCKRSLDHIQQYMDTTLVVSNHKQSLLLLLLLLYIRGTFVAPSIGPSLPTVP